MSFRDAYVPSRRVAPIMNVFDSLNKNEQHEVRLLVGAYLGRREMSRVIVTDTERDRFLLFTDPTDDFRETLALLAAFIDETVRKFPERVGSVMKQYISTTTHKIEREYRYDEGALSDIFNVVMPPTVTLKIETFDMVD